VKHDIVQDGRDKLVNALQCFDKNEDHDRNTLDYIGESEITKALFYSLVAAVQSGSDKSILQFIDCLRISVSIKSAVAILEYLVKDMKRSSIYHFALIHYLSESGRQELAQKVEANCDPSETVPAHFLLSAINVLLSCNDHKRAFMYVEAISRKQGAEFPSWAQLINIYVSRCTDREQTSKVVELSLKFCTSLSDADKLFVTIFQLQTQGHSLLMSDLSDEARNYAIEANRFVLGHPILLEYDFAKRTTESQNFLKETPLMEQIFAAIDQDKQFSFIRMGDGEGRYVSDLRSYPLLLSESDAIAKRV